MIKGVLFDLDGTLLDRDTSLLRFTEDQYERFPELQRVDRDQYIRRFVELDARGYVWKDKVYEQLVREMDLELSWERLLEDYIAGFRLHCIGYPHLREMLTALKRQGMKLGIISNGFGEFQWGSIQGLGIADDFDAILISELEGLRKPDPAIFRRALDRLELQPEEAVFVGDHAVNDVEASRMVGMKAVWMKAAAGDTSCETDYSITDLMELKDILSN
ncbi:HAD family hydrolase [Paenibacillus sp. VMFN-D1]|uniref:HAD family hydrolase n=1 Tax=Paenibacillus sp. VMFN-D1 TaxID=2135608 RepID=UPI000E264177|nr:HAD family hydrolase [Paenibacillus sp. VMFN-D1]RED36702.1 putative hydrolase of the HAD superfamily [Paenibacillus sp. VMFN-D1]